LDHSLFYAKGSVRVAHIVSRGPPYDNRPAFDITTVLPSAKGYIRGGLVTADYFRLTKVMCTALWLVKVFTAPLKPHSVWLHHGPDLRLRRRAALKPTTVFDTCPNIPHRFQTFAHPAARIYRQPLFSLFGAAA